MNLYGIIKYMYMTGFRMDNKCGLFLGRISFLVIVLIVLNPFAFRGWVYQYTNLCGIIKCTCMTKWKRDSFLALPKLAYPSLYLWQYHIQGAALGAV